MTKFLTLFLMTFSPAVFADEVIGKVQTRGILVKDSIEVIAFDDPSVKGVTCYTTLYNRKLSFSDASESSISCVKTSKIEGELKSEKNIFSQSKSLLFVKTTQVDRFYDAKRRVLVYLTYTKDFDDKNASHQLFSIPID